jgi:tetratricopeptide (TPR) repeat protein
MPFFYDKVSRQSGVTQYMAYLENEIYIQELKKHTDDVINYQLVEARRAIGKNTEGTKQAILNSTIQICGSLENGLKQISESLEDIGWRLNDLNEGIHSLHAMLDWKTDLIIEEQKITNFYLGNIARLLKIPDSQKQRSYYVEQGIIYLKNAIDEGSKSDFYEDAINEFTKAQKIEEKDYFCLHKLGLILLNSSKHLDIHAADSYFKASARYAKAIANATPSNLGQPKFNENIQPTLTKEILIQEAASALNYASRCNYILDNLPEAIVLAKQAFELHGTNPEYGIQVAKCLSANGQVDSAAEILKKIIEMDKYYAVKALTDIDLISKKPIQSMLNVMSEVLIELIEKEIKHLNAIIIRDSKMKPELSEIENQFLSSKTYINARIAAEKLF